MGDHTSNITSRRRAKKRKSESGAESDQDYDQPSTSTALLNLDPAIRKQQRDLQEAKNNILLERAKRQAESRQAKQEGNREYQSSIVAQLLNAQKESKLLLTNCFEQRTVLDVIDKSCVDRETISDMAVAIDAASTVYGYRVDKTHLDAQETSVNFTKSIAENSPHKKSEDELKKEAPVVPKKDKGATTDLQNRLQQLMNQEQSVVYDEDVDSDDNNDDGEDIEEELVARNDIRDQLVAIKERRYKKASRMKWRNLMLEEDEDKLSMKFVESIDNDYYQQAISKHGDQNANSLLLNNARSSGDGRLLYVHSHIEQDRIPINANCSKNFIHGVRGNIVNALSIEFQAPENNFLPKYEPLNCTLFIGSAKSKPIPEVEEDVDLFSDNVGDHQDAPTEENDPSSESVLQNEESAMDMTEFPDRTIMETTMAPNMTIMMPKKRKISRQSKIRGQDITEMWISDEISLPTEESSIDFEAMKKLAADRIENGIPKKKSMFNSEEFAIPSEDLRLELMAMENSGFDVDFRDLECVWNATLVEKTVTENDAESMARDAEAQGGSKEDIYARKKRLLLPGKHVYFMDIEDKPICVPADPWVEEADIAARFDQNNIDDREVDSLENNFEDFTDNNYIDDFEDVDTGTPRAEPPTDEFLTELMDAEINSADSDQNAVNTNAPGDDVPDVPADGPQLDTNFALRSLGKEDNAHWKAGQNVPEKEKKTRKEKSRDEPKSEEHYFVLSSETDRAEAENRFNTVKSSLLEKSEDSLFLKQRTTERRPYSFAYDFEMFIKPGLLFQGKYGGIRFQRSMPAHVDDDKFNQGLSSNMEVEDGEVEDVCKEWLGMFSGFRIITQDEESETEESIDLQSPEHDDFPYEEDDNFSIPFVPVPTTATTERDPAQEIFLSELWNIQNDEYESDEDESETVTIMEKKVTITNTNIDQSRVKAYMREILMSPWMTADILQKKTNMSCDENANGGNCEPFLSDNDDCSISSEDAAIVKAVFAPPQDIQQDTLKKVLTTFGDDSTEQVTSGVVVSDFNVQGVHSMSSLAAILPSRVTRKAEKNMHVAFAFSIALQMCNENMLHLSQARPDGERTGLTETWMGDFIVRNATPPPEMENG